MITTPIERRIIKKETEITKKLTQLAWHSFNKKPRDTSWHLKNDSLEEEISELQKQWFELKRKQIVAGRKVCESWIKVKRKDVKIEFYKWEEHFVDEDTGEVVGIERTRVITINDILVDDSEKPIIFNIKDLINRIQITKNAIQPKRRNVFQGSIMLR